jgi:hypothetical protein
VPLALAWACGSKVPAQNAAQDSRSEQQAGTPADLKKQFEREADPIQKQPVRGVGWQAYIETESSPELEQTDGYLMITAELGWDGPINCFVYNETIDAGAASHAVISEAGKSVEFQQLLPYHLGGVGLNPTLGIRGVYHVEQDGVVAAGDLKLMLVPRLEHPILCTHDAPGFAHSFARVTRDFAESFEFESKMPAPVRAELWHAKLEDVPVGFAQRFTYESPTGAARTVSISARFVPRAPGEISFEDTVRIVDWDKQGLLESGRFLSFENGQSSFELNLQKAKAKYQYSGTVQDKPISGSFRSKQISGQLTLERRLKKIARSKRASTFHQWEYLPSLDPVQTSKVTYKVSHQAGVVLVKASMGERAMVMQANTRGVVQQQSFQVGPRHVQVDLVQETGEL